MMDDSITEMIDTRVRRTPMEEGEVYIPPSIYLTHEAATESQLRELLPTDFGNGDGAVIKYQIQCRNGQKSVASHEIYWRKQDLSEVLLHRDSGRPDARWDGR